MKMTTMPVKMEESKKMDEVKHAAEILIKAEEIKADKHLMEHVNLELKKKGKVITSLADLKSIVNEAKDEEPGVDDFPDESEPEIERKDEMGTVLKSPDESGVEIQGPAVKHIYTKPPVKSVSDIRKAKNKNQMES